MKLKLPSLAHNNYIMMHMIASSPLTEVLPGQEESIRPHIYSKVVFCIRSMESDAYEYRLDKLYFCSECRAIYLFASDLDEHHANTGHSGTCERPFELKT
jgi:hypothetical protein